MPKQGAFRSAARRYRARGFLGTLPLPPGKKHPPPAGFTGGGKAHPTDHQVAQWARNQARGNIALRLAEVPREFLEGRDDLPPIYAGNNVDGWELVGIDIDNYTKGESEKRGAAQLGELEAELGQLPATALSGARLSTGSCIAVFLVPKGYRFAGKAADSIEVIQKRHRYMVVHPSVNPDAEDADGQPATYEWGWGAPSMLTDAGADTLERIEEGIPTIADIAVLPELWFTRLTHGGTEESDDPISDMTDGQLWDWLTDRRGFGDEMCSAMKSAVDEWVAKIGASTSSHDVLRDAQWRLLNLAAEGHAGVAAALDAVARAGLPAALGKRDIETLRGEMGRGIAGALDKIQPIFGTYVPDDRCAVDANKFDCDAWAARTIGEQNEPVTRSLADVVPTKVLWLWRPWLPLGKVSILEGDPDVGKSMLTLTIAAIVSTGGEWPQTRIDDHDVEQDDGEPAGVVLVGVEDDEGDTIVPRLMAAGADLSRVAAMRQPTGESGDPMPFVIPDDVDRLRRAIAEVDARLVVIDPVTAFISTRRVKPGDDPSTRQALMPLVALARETGCAILLVRHLNKATGMTAKHRGSGTVAYTGITRSVIVAGKLKEPKLNGPTHAIALTKGNLTKDPNALGYKLISASSDPDTPVVRWHGALDLDADQLLGADGAKAGDARKSAPVRDECERILRELLADGSMRADEATTKTREVVNCSAKPVRDAANHMGVVKRSVRVGSKIDHWTWELPPTTVRLRPADEGDGDV